MDRYSKAVLTVIALSLAVIAFKLPGGSAQAMGDGCGSMTHPCYIDTAALFGLPVKVENWPR